MSRLIREIQTANKQGNSHLIDPCVVEESLTQQENWSSWLSKHSKVFKNVAVVCAFYGFGILFYHYRENWNIVDCVYFITVSLTTVGYGDLSPTDDGSRIFTIFYVIFGLVFIFTIINDFARSILDYAEKKALENLDDDPTDLKEPHGWKIALSFFMIILCVLVGTLFFQYNENWTFIRALYWSFITTLTVGYGDLTLEYESSRIFSIFYIIVSVIVVAGAIGNLAAIDAEIKHEKQKLALLERKLDLSAILAMDVDGGGVDKVEFLTAMLVQMNGLDMERDIKPWLKRFDELDKDGSGALDGEDLRLFALEEEQIKLAALAKIRSGREAPNHATNPDSAISSLETPQNKL